MSDDYVTIREFERVEDRIYAGLDSMDAKMTKMAEKQDSFFANQAGINQTVSDMAKKYNAVSAAVVLLIVGSIYNKVVTTPVINQHKEIPKEQPKNETKDLITQ